jgi:hypothetical protein
MWSRIVRRSAFRFLRPQPGYWPRQFTLSCLIGSVLTLLLLGTGWAQSGTGTDVVIKIVNGTTREAGTAEKVEIYLLGATQQPVATALEVQAEATLTNLSILTHVQYILQVTANDVSYFKLVSGEELTTGPVTVYTFATSSDLAGLAITGLNLVIRLGEGDLELEFLITVTNSRSPQETVVPQPTTLEIALPTGAGFIEVESLRGPSPLAVATSSVAQTGWIGLAEALPPGQTRLQVACRVPYQGRLQLPLGANLPIQAWSVLAFPSDLIVTGQGLETSPVEVEGDFSRQKGQPLAAGDTLLLEVKGGTGPVIEAVEFGEAPLETLAGQTPASAPEAGKSIWRYGWIILLLIIIVLYTVRRRRG